MLKNLSRVVRYGIVLGVVAATLVLAPVASARVRVGFNVNIALPPGVLVSVGNYAPYYVGRVFYEPLAVWRPVYSFPVETPYGVVYEPYIYDGGQVVCHDYIPGPDAGYGEFIIEGRGYYNPQWHSGRPYGYAARTRGYYYQDRGWNDHGRGWDDGRAYSRNRDWDREREWHHDRDHDWDRDHHRHEDSGSGRHHGKNHKHDHR